MTARAANTAPQPRESVWDYPPEGRFEPTAKHVRVIFAGLVIADTWRAVRVLERGLPPDYYIPPEDVKMEHLWRGARTSFCAAKGKATYYAARIWGREVEVAAWSYRETPERAKAIEGYIAFYPNCMDACYVDGERVARRNGDYYAGWITSDIEGPFVGDPGVDYDPQADRGPGA